MNSNKENSEYSFTPKPAVKTKANHAWERKPATPFAARNEHQKIWKRYDLPGEQFQKIEIRRRKSPLHNKRSVKKIKMSNNEDNTRGNGCGTKWDEADEGGDIHKRILRKSKNVSPVKVTFEVHEDVASSDSDAQEVEGPVSDDEDTQSQNAQDLTEPTILISTNDEDIEIQNLETFSEAIATEDEGIQPDDAQNSPGGVTTIDENADVLNTHIENPLKDPTDPAVMLNPLRDPVTDAADETTAYLQSFLSRVKAGKAANAVAILSPSQQYTATIEPGSINASPMTRSRVALLSVSPNAVESPTKKPTEESPVRRSTRTSTRKSRSAPTTTTTTTNQIPVLRRPKGTEFVFLTRTEAQQIELATKSNTRKNKAGAVEPSKRLREAIEARTPSPKKRKATAKTVAWDEKLAYFLEKQKEAEEEREKEQVTPPKKKQKGRGEKKPAAAETGRSRRAKRLTNGTPVSRRVLAGDY